MELVSSNRYSILFLLIAVCYMKFGLSENSLHNAHSDIVCCECVSFFLCVKNTIVTDGVGVLDVRIGGQRTTTPTSVNVESCSDASQICCQVPDPDPICLDRSQVVNKDTEVILTPDPNSSCECMPYNECEPHLVVSNGLGATTIKLSNGRLVSHSQCRHSLDVCCYLPDMPLGNFSDVSAECECVDPLLCGPDGHIQEHGIGVINLRFGSTPRKSCPYDPNLVCCLPPKANTEFPVSVDKPSLSPNVKPIPKCECVQPFLCGPDGTIRTDGAGIINVRIGPSKRPEVCPYDPSLVCCFPPVNEVEHTTKPSVVISSPAVVPREEHCECVSPEVCSRRRDFLEANRGILGPMVAGKERFMTACPYDPSLVCCDFRNYERKTTPKPLLTHSPSKAPPCGLRNSDGVGVRILGFQGGQTQFGEFPWVASILKKQNILDKNYTVFVGGASLIHPRVVLTAAHKIPKDPSNKLFVRLGEWDTASKKEALPYRDISVQNIIIHPRYAAGPLFHDIALLVLKEEAQFAFHINPICIAKSLDEVLPVGCITNGWGVDAFRSNNYQEIMKSVTLPLVSKNECQRLLRKTRLSRHFRLHPSFICAGGEEGIDSCKGDGGGPLACPKKTNPSQYLQVGITAWGIGCGEKDVPGVYADVPAHYNWISDQVAFLEQSFFSSREENTPYSRPLSG